MDTPEIKVITGVRRSGKSKLLDRFCDFLIDNISNQISSRTRQEAYQYEGVQIIDVADWLLHD